MPGKQQSRRTGGTSIYIAVALTILALGIVACILALTISGCHSDSGTPADVSSPNGSAASDPVISEAGESSSGASDGQTSDHESASPSSQAEEISLPEESHSDLPVLIEGQPASAMRFEESIGLRYQIDMNPYEQYVNPEDSMEYVFLVNPAHTLGSDYVPEDLVDCAYTRKDGRKMQQLRLYAEKALEAFMAEGALNGVTNVTVTSAYRSYSYQDYLFNHYVEQNMSKFKTRADCEKYVLTFSTKPGTSEHQSGLCCDMHNLSSAQQSFAKKPEAKWLAENCWRFGFILRYPEDKEEITKIIYEPWHFRFVGREAATEMHNLGMCLDEYCVYLGMYDQ